MVDGRVYGFILSHNKVRIMANRCYLVSYDVREPRRLRRVHRTLKGYGEAWQDSVFFCRIGPANRQNLETDLCEIINQKLDQVLIIDLGPDEDIVRDSVKVLGTPLPEQVPRILVL